MFSLEETAKLSSKVVIPFCIPMTKKESSYCSISLSAFGVVGVLDFHHSVRCVVVSNCYFNCLLFLIDNFSMFNILRFYIYFILLIKINSK
jgi:hypothetical protein